MRILLLSYSFPPFNEMGSIRPGKTAKYLIKFGHDVRVITAANQLPPPTLPLEVPRETIAYTQWLDVNKPAAVGSRILRIGRNGASRGFQDRQHSHSRIHSTLSKIDSIYRVLLNIPDGQVGWLPYAIWVGSRMLNEWRPDVIYATAPSYTALLVGRSLSRQSGIPWVAELRDLWADNPYYDHPKWRKSIEQWLEKTVLSTAAGLVTVTQPMAALLGAKHAKPIVVVRNGFDPADYPPESERLPQGNTVRILYTGTIYEGKRDPSPLFQAIRLLGPKAPQIRVEFFGRKMQGVMRLANLHGVEHVVSTHDPVPYEDSLRNQREADILLLLLWNDPKDQGVCPGKVYEYIGARRPILAIGPMDNVAAELIRERRAGVALQDPVQIAQQLQEWIRQKQETGVIPDLHQDVGAGLSREEQTREIEAFLRALVGSSEPYREK